MIKFCDSLYTVEHCRLRVECKIVEYTRWDSRVECKLGGFK